MCDGMQLSALHWTTGDLLITWISLCLSVFLQSSIIPCYFSEPDTKNKCITLYLHVMREDEQLVLIIPRVHGTT